MHKKERFPLYPCGKRLALQRYMIAMPRAAHLVYCLRQSSLDRRHQTSFLRVRAPRLYHLAASVYQQRFACLPASLCMTTDVLMPPGTCLAVSWPDSVRNSFYDNLFPFATLPRTPQAETPPCQPPDNSHLALNHNTRYKSHPSAGQPSPAQLLLLVTWSYTTTWRYSLVSSSVRVELSPGLARGSTLMTLRSRLFLNSSPASLSAIT